MNFIFEILILKRIYEFVGKRWDKKEGKVGQGGSVIGNILID